MYAGYTDQAGSRGFGRWDYGEVSPMQASAEYSEMFGTVLYAVRLGDEIKIGVTSHLQRRLVGLASLTHRKPELLAIKAGSRADEQALHDQLAAHCRRGREWYAPASEVLAVINEWRAELRRDPIAS